MLTLWIFFGALFSLPQRARADELEPWLTERRIIGNNDLELIEKAAGTLVYEQGRAIARVEMMDEGTSFCTATRVGPDLFIANFHCVNLVPCKNTQFHLGFEQDKKYEEQLIVHCKEVLAKNLSYDYVLYRVETTGTQPDPTKQPPEMPGPAGEPVPDQPLPEHPDIAPSLDTFPAAVLGDEPITVGQRLFVISHPRGRRKSVDRSSDCKLTSIEPQLVEARQSVNHTCDTEGGSSGAPLMDYSTGHIVGLHWGGIALMNMGIPMTLILTDLRATLAPEVLGQLNIVKAPPPTAWVVAPSL